MVHWKDPGRVAEPAVQGSADPSGKAGVHKCNPDFEIWGEGTPPCKPGSPPQGSRRQPGSPEALTKRGSTPTRSKAPGGSPTLGSAHLRCNRTVQEHFTLCVSIFQKKQIPLFSSVFKLHSLCGHLSGIARNIFYYRYIKKPKCLLE